MTAEGDAETHIEPPEVAFSDEKQLPPTSEEACVCSSTPTTSDQLAARTKNDLRRQRKEERYLRMKEHRKANRKEKKLKRKLKRQQTAEDTGAKDGAQNLETKDTEKVNRVEEENEADDQIELKSAARWRKKREEFMAACSSQPVVVIDCDFEDIQTDKEKKSLVQQLMLCYGSNRRAQRPVRLSLVGLGEGLLKELHRINGFEAWVCEKESRPIDDSQHALDKMVYLTADADDTLDTLDKDTVYVIGGFIDRNRHKGLTAAKARQLGLRTSRLPIQEHVKIDGSKVLTVNQVLDILLAFLETESWAAALERVVPSRKRRNEDGLPHIGRRRRKVKGDEGEEDGESSAPPSSSSPPSSLPTASHLSSPESREVISSLNPLLSSFPCHNTTQVKAGVEEAKGMEKREGEGR